MLSTTAVFYHADCLDGFAAAYAAWSRFGEQATYRAFHHGDTWEADEIAGRDVYILDFSFPPADLTAMASVARSVTQIDHHLSARHHWEDKLSPVAAAESDNSPIDLETKRESYTHPNLPLEVIFDLHHAGAWLAWNFFHPELEVPLAIRHIEDMDLWRFTLPETRAFCRTLRLKPFDFKTWADIFARTQTEESPHYGKMVAQGAAIELFYLTEVQRLAGSQLVMTARLRGEPIDTLQAVRHSQEIITDGTNAWLAIPGQAINANALFASELGTLLAEQSGTYGLVWHLSPTGDVRVSLRSKGNFDVSRIAARYGGGGHRNASGFRIKIREFLDEVLVQNRE